MKPRSWAALAGAAVLLFLAAMEVLCQETLKPGRHVAELRVPAGAASTPASIRARDGATLDATFVSPQASQGRCVLMLHGIVGSRGDMSPLLPPLLDAGYRVLLPDLRGHGSSGGELLTYGLLERGDVLDWALWMRGQGCDSIYGLGVSLGASILVQTAGAETAFSASAQEQPPFRAIVAECPFSDLRWSAESRVREHMHLPGVLNDWIGVPISRLVIGAALPYAKARYDVDLTQVDPVRSISRASTPILLIHGTDDRKTPYWHSQALAAANSRAELWLVPGAPHAAARATHPEEFDRRTLAWFGRF